MDRWELIRPLRPDRRRRPDKFGVQRTDDVAQKTDDIVDDVPNIPQGVGPWADPRLDLEPTRPRMRKDG